MAQYGQEYIRISLENKESEIGRHHEIAESEIKVWFSMGWNMWGFVLENKESDLGKQNEIAESEITFGFVWTRICKQFY